MVTWPKVSINTEQDLAMCFGCGQSNPIGLKLNFKWDGKMAKAEFTPAKIYQGWPGMVHGGIIICILDEAMAYAARFEGMDCVTAKIQAELKRPTSINESLLITSSLTKKNRKLVKAKAKITLTDGTLIAESTAIQFIINRRSADIGNKEGKPKVMLRSKTKAVIWDMDGVIADTAPYHLKAWQQVFQKRGVNFTENDFRHIFGQRNDTIIKNVLGKSVPLSEIDAIAGEKEKSFRQSVRQHITPLPGAVELIKALKEHGFSIALASSAPIENIQLIFGGLDLNDCFQAIVSGREVKEGKPSPQGFLLAAKKLGVAPQNCIVVEDAVVGITAAKRAGMRCLAVTNTHPRTRLMEADLIVDTLETVGVNILEGLLNRSREA